MRTRTIRVLKTCKQCEGRGLETIEGYDTDCRVCDGYGQVTELERKDVEVDERLLSTRSE